MEIYQAVILGIVQGLTEFLPVSSSGHLVLGQACFGMTKSLLIFDISVHVGTLFAVLVVYFSDISDILRSVFSLCSKAVQLKPVRHIIAEDTHLKMALWIITGSVPTAIAGLILKQFEYVLFSSTLLVGFALILTGTILWLSRPFCFRQRKETPVGIKRSLIIGAAQGLAVIPGISRSGATIATAMFVGLDRKTAARFSFLLSIPAIVGAEILSVKDMFEKGLTIDIGTIYAAIASFVTGLIALKIVLSLVHSGRLHLFAPYCWLVGVLVLFSTLM